MFNVNALLIISKFNVLNHCSIRHFLLKTWVFPDLVLTLWYCCFSNFQWLWNFQNSKTTVSQGRSFCILLTHILDLGRPWSDNLTHVLNLLLYFSLNFSADLDTSTKLHCSQYTGRILLGNHDLACRIY